MEEVIKDLALETALEIAFSEFPQGLEPKDLRNHYEYAVENDCFDEENGWRVAEQFEDWSHSADTVSQLIGTLERDILTGMEKVKNLCLI